MLDTAKKKIDASFSADDYWNEKTAAHMTVAEETFASAKESLMQWVDISVEAIEKGGKVYFFGNGGSAADAQHIAAEMTIKLHQERSPIAALSLTLDPSAITACANDYGYDTIFQRQLRALGREGDIAVGLSTSGNSPNIVNGLKKAQRMNMKTIGLTGISGGKMNKYCDLLLHVPATDPGRIQEMHITLGHIYVGILEKKLGLV